MIDSISGQSAMEIAQIAPSLSVAGQTIRLPAIHISNAPIVSALCGVATVLLCATLLYIALHGFWPAVALIHIQERLRGWHRDSLYSGRGTFDAGDRTGPDLQAVGP